MATYTISVKDPADMERLEALIKELESATVREKSISSKGLERIESVEALSRRVEEGRQMNKVGLYLTDNELDKEIQQWLEFSTDVTSIRN
jgi:hypothetical protein